MLEYFSLSHTQGNCFKIYDINHKNTPKFVIDFGGSFQDILAFLFIYDFQLLIIQYRHDSVSFAPL